MLLAALSALAILEGAFNAIPDSHTIASVGWAGYIVASSFNHQQEVTFVSGSWTVPEINASAGNGYSSAWVGIGGQQDKTLIQVGTEHNVVNGAVSYGVWYEMLPAYSVRIGNFTLTPGDLVTASITLVNSDSNEWNIQLTDITTGQIFNQNFSYNSTHSSAEWIVERSTVNGQLTSLPDFGTITFDSCTTNLGSEKGIINNFTYSVVQMTNQQYDRLATASTLSSNGASFTVTYNRNS